MLPLAVTNPLELPHPFLAVTLLSFLSSVFLTVWLFVPGGLRGAQSKQSSDGRIRFLVSGYATLQAVCYLTIVPPELFRDPLPQLLIAAALFGPVLVVSAYVTETVWLLVNRRQRPPHAEHFNRHLSNSRGLASESPFGGRVPDERLSEYLLSNHDGIVGKPRDPAPEEDPLGSIPTTPKSSGYSPRGGLLNSLALWKPQRRRSADRALQSKQVELEANPLDPRLRRELILLYLGRNEPQQAIYHSYALVELLPYGASHALALYRLCQLLVGPRSTRNRRELKIAQPYLRRLIRLYPRSFFASYARRLVNQYEAYAD